MRTRVAAVALGAAVCLASACARLPRSPVDPLTPAEHNELGVAYHARGEHALAEREFRRAAAGRPGWGLALRNLGDAQLAQGRLEPAIESYEAALRASPDDPATANNLAWALLRHPTRWPEAEPLVRSALAREPPRRGYYLDTLGVLLLRKGAPGEALAAFREALRDPDLGDPRTRAGVALHAAEALEALGEASAAERCRLAARRLSAPEPGGADSVGGIAALC